MKTAAERLQLPYGYICVRRTGATHAEAMEIFETGISIYEYARAYRAGISHTEMLDALRMLDFAFINRYFDVRKNGATHAEAIKITQLHQSEFKK